VSTRWGVLSRMGAVQSKNSLACWSVAVAGIGRGRGNRRSGVRYEGLICSRVLENACQDWVV